MNNIRKIIEERLENARLEFGKTTREFNAELKGQIEAYQDCLNLMQPRTEKEILKDFEALGWTYEEREKYKIFSKTKQLQLYGTLSTNVYSYIRIDIEQKTYSAWKIVGILSTSEYEITMQEHKLLSELFICWGGGCR